LDFLNVLADLTGMSFILQRQMPQMWTVCRRSSKRQ
jgi:hypothetical protein